jgi:putative oxidoreductase
MNALLDLLSTNADWAVTTARTVLALVFFAHGAQKLLGWYGAPGFKDTVEMLVTHVHLPKALAVLVIRTEFFGGLGLMVGFFSRLAAFGAFAAMLGAIVTTRSDYS